VRRRLIANALDMKKFKTLGGFLGGDEPAEPDYFGYSVSPRNFGDSLDLDEITRRVGVTPTRTHRKGDSPGPRSPAFAHDMWSYEPPLPEERPLEEHIDALWEAIRPARDYLLALKKTATVDVFLGYRSNIDHAGIEVPHTSLEMFTSLEVPFGLSIIVA
jgi:hypothetical protein